MVSTGTGILTTNAAGSLPLYESDPSICEFIPLERKGGLSGELTALRIEETKTGRDGNTYCGYKTGEGTNYYVKEEMAKEYEVTFEKLFHALQEDGQSGNDSDIQETLEAQRAGKTEEELYQWLRSCVVKHPMEWDKGLYDEKAKGRLQGLFALDDERFERIKGKLEKQDVWGGIKGKAGLPEANNLWFVHPAYFINHLDKGGLLKINFNPYEHYSPITGKDMGDFGDNYQAIIIKSNPGFATAGEKNDERFKYQDTEYSNIFWGKINTPANQAYGSGNAQVHIGVDFAGIEGTVIYSLIYGEVWACTYDRHIDNAKEGIGICMAIKSRDEDILYIIGHLARREYLLSPGSKVEPRQPVAYAGNTGNSSGIHLHVEARECNETEREKVFSTDANKGWQEKNGNNGLRIIDASRYQRVDPFNHGEKIR